MKYKSKRSVRDDEPDEVTVLSSLKVFGDFKRLHGLIKATGFTDEEGRSLALPSLPAKVDKNGMKKQDFEMTSDLETYLQKLLAIPKVARMISVKQFLLLG